MLRFFPLLYPAVVGLLTLGVYLTTKRLEPPPQPTQPKTNQPPANFEQLIDEAGREKEPKAA